MELDEDIADPVEAPARPPQTVGELIDRLTTIKQERAVLSKSDKALKQKEDEIDAALMELLQASGTTGAAGKTASVSIQESIVPNAKDWPTIYKYIADNDYFHLLNKALNAAACRELFERDGGIPGIEPFQKRSLRYSAR